jgi:hypothetical protein
LASNFVRFDTKKAAKKSKCQIGPFGFIKKDIKFQTGRRLSKVAVGSVGVSVAVSSRVAGVSGVTQAGGIGVGSTVEKGWVGLSLSLTLADEVSSVDSVGVVSSLGGEVGSLGLLDSQGLGGGDGSVGVGSQTKRGVGVGVVGSIVELGISLSLGLSLSLALSDEMGVSVGISVGVTRVASIASITSVT